MNEMAATQQLSAQQVYSREAATKGVDGIDYFTNN
jgi:hypothetical protein